MRNHVEDAMFAYLTGDKEQVAIHEAYRPKKPPVTRLSGVETAYALETPYYVYNLPQPTISSPARESQCEAMPKSQPVWAEVEDVFLIDGKLFVNDSALAERIYRTAVHIVKKRGFSRINRGGSVHDVVVHRVFGYTEDAQLEESPWGPTDEYYGSLWLEAQGRYQDSGFVEWLTDQIVHWVANSEQNIRRRENKHVSDDTLELGAGVFVDWRRERLKELKNERQRQIIELLLDGWRQEEIAVHMGCHVRTVRRDIQEAAALNTHFKFETSDAPEFQI